MWGFIWSCERMLFALEQNQDPLSTAVGTHDSIGYPSFPSLASVVISKPCERQPSRGAYGSSVVFWG